MTLRETQGSELEQGMDLVRGLREVMPEDAPAPVREVYEDVRRRLRVPFVNYLFRALANYPDFLTGAWWRLAPGLGTRAFEHEADRLREEALLCPVPHPSERDWQALGGGEVFRPFTETLHYVLPKLLLVASAMDDGLASDQADRPEIPLGIAPGAVGAEMADPERVEPRVKRLFDDVRDHHGHPGVASYYRVLGRYPDLLEAVWNDLRPRVRSAEYDAQSARLRGLATERSREVWPREGVAADGEPHLVLTVFRGRLIPDLLLDLAMVRCLLDGPDAARTSRLSVR